MPEVIYPTSCRLRGPFLLSSEILTNLDRIVAEQKPILIGLREKRINEYIAERVLEAKQEGMADPELESRKKYWTDYAQQTVAEFSCELTVQFSDDTRLEADSFAEALAHSEFSSVPAEGFDLSLKCGSIELHLEAESNFETDMSLKVTPSNAEGAKKLFADVRRWMRTVQAPLWQQWWCYLGHARYFVWGPAMMMIIIALSVALGGTDDNYYKKQARELLQQGVTQNNQSKAIEILLALESKASAPTAHRLGHWYWFFFIGIFVMGLILSYPPKLVLGLGRGDDKIKYWRAWTKFVFIVVPTFIATNFLWPYLSDLVKKWFG
ncbi:MAG TPA: hypothetical protein VGS27_02085 [Candidatus Sulfotelmatobacter sp.]|nr:hypothetical protein [Candidatus Sulfotelmatobacter sp.]